MAHHPGRLRQAPLHRRLIAPASLAGMLLLASCGDVVAPDALSPEDLLGAWHFRSPECEYWGATSPSLTVNVAEAGVTFGGYLNLRGSWDEIGLPPTSVPSEGVFSGNVDRASGEFELLLWQAGHQAGEFRGTVSPDRTAEGALTWGFCRGKRGARVPGS